MDQEPRNRWRRMPGVQTQIEAVGRIPWGISALAGLGAFGSTVVGIVGDVFNVIGSWPLWDTLGGAFAGLATTAGLWGHERRKNVKLQAQLTGIDREMRTVAGQRDDALRQRDDATNLARGQVIDGMLRDGYSIQVDPPNDRGR